MEAKARPKRLYPDFKGANADLEELVGQWRRVARALRIHGLRIVTDSTINTDVTNG